MITLNNTDWVLVSSTGLLMQKFGSSTVLLCYAAATPDGTEAIFTAQLPQAQQFPAVTGKSVYLKAFAEDVNVSFEEVA